MIKIFDANEKVFSSNGNIVINPTKCIEYKKKSLNGWYIECEIPIKYKDYIEKDKLCVIKSRSKLNPQAFRIGDTIKKTRTRISFIANHVMFDAKNYFLLDVRPTKLNGAGALEYINQRTDKKSPFSIFSNVGNTNTEYFIKKNLLEAWTLIEERWQGVFDADNWKISFLNKVGNDNGEMITYGKNLENLTIFEDWSNVCTKLYPEGYDGLMLPEKFIESDIQYEQPYTKTIKFDSNLETDTRTEKEMIEELRNFAIEYLQKNKYPKVSYELSSNINQNMEIGDTIVVKHPLVDIKTEVLEYANNVNTGKIFSITFGNYSRTVKAKFDNIKTTINQITQNVSKQERVIAEQTNLINTLNKTGYVYIDENEILILDTLPKENAKNVWRFGLGGLGFSSNGYEGPFETAITMDGQINGKFITTGKIQTNIIEGLTEAMDEWSAIMLDVDNISLLVAANSRDIGSLEASIKLLQNKIDLAVTEGNVISKIQLAINNGKGSIAMKSNQFSISSDNFTLTAQGVLTSKAGNIGGWNISVDKLSKTISQKLSFTLADADEAQKYIRHDGNIYTLDAYKYLNYDTNFDGELDITDVVGIINIAKGTATKSVTGSVSINANNIIDTILIESSTLKSRTSIGARGVTGKIIAGENIIANNFQLNGTMRMQVATSGGVNDITGHPVLGEGTNNTYTMKWDGTYIHFYVDGADMAQVRGRVN